MSTTPPPPPGDFPGQPGSGQPGSGQPGGTPPPPGGTPPPTPGTPPPPGGTPPPTPGTPPPPGGAPTPPPPTPGAPPPVPPPTPGAPGAAPPPQGFGSAPGQYGAAAPAEKKSGLPGWAWALIIIGALVVLCGGGGVVACGVLIDDAADNLEDAVDESFGEVSDSEYSVEVDECEVDDFGFVSIAGEITNDTGERQALQLDISVEDDDGTLLESTTAISDTLDDGQTGAWSTSAAVDEGADVTCEVKQVNRTIFD